MIIMVHINCNLSCTHRGLEMHSHFLMQFKLTQLWTILIREYFYHVEVDPQDLLVIKIITYNKYVLSNVLLIKQTGKFSVIDDASMKQFAAICFFIQLGTSTHGRLLKTLTCPLGQLMVDTVIQWHRRTFRICTNSPFSVANPKASPSIGGGRPPVCG